MKYTLDSMLPIRAFSPRSGRARGFAAGGMTLEGSYDEGYRWWDDYSNNNANPEPQGSVTVESAPANAGGGGGGGGAVDQGTLNQLYEQYLGRGVDPSGAATWAGQSYEDVVRGITGSQEYANRGIDVGGGGGGGLEQPWNWSGGASDNVTQAGNLPGQDFNAPPTSNTEFVNKLYQDVFGRAPDEGAANWINALQTGQMTPQDVANSFVTSTEAQQNKIPQTTEQAIADAIAQGYTSGGLGVEAPKVNASKEVADIYQQVLGRAPDAGAQTWIDAISSGRNNVADVADMIARSAEAKNRMVSMLPGNLAQNDPNNFTQNVSQLYAAALGRAPTSEELAANVNAMNANPDSFAWIAKTITDSKEAQDRAAKYGYDAENLYQNVVGSYGHFTPTPEQGGIGGFFQKVGPYLPFAMAAAALAAPALAGTAAAEGAAAAGAAGAGAGTAAGTTAAGITGNAALDAVLAGAGKGALTGAAMGGISSGIQGGNIGQGILRGGLTGAVGGGIGGGLTNAFPTWSPLATNVLSGAGAGATGAALSGGNIGRGALYGAGSGALNYGASQIPGLQSTPGQFGIGDIARGAITGGALSSAMGGNFGKGALGGIGGAYLSNAISPYINSTYDKYFGTPTPTSNVNYGVAPTGINGTGIGFTSGAMDQALQQGLSTTPTTLSDLTTPADMQAALAIASPYIQTPEDAKLAEIAANFGVPPEALKDMLAQGEIQSIIAGREEGVQTAGLSGKEYDMAKSAYDRYLANPDDPKAAKAYDETFTRALAAEANKPQSSLQKINDNQYFDSSFNEYWNRGSDGSWRSTPAAGVPSAADEVNLGATDKNALTPGGVYGFGTPDVKSSMYAIGGTGSTAAPGEIASPIGLWGSGTGAGGAEPDMTDVSENQIKYKDPVTGEWKTADAVELADIKSPDGKVQTAVPQDKVEKVVEQKEQVAKDKEAAADKAEKEAEKAGGGGQEGKTEDAKAKLEEAKTKAEQARKDAEAARADANAAKSASQQGQSGKITSIDKTTNVATIQFPNGDVTKAIVDPDAEINMQARVATTEAYGKGTPTSTAGAGIPTGNQFAQMTTNKDGSQTYQNDDGSTYTIDKDGNLIETVDTEGQKYNIDENGQLVAVTGKEEGTPGSGGGTGGGAGTGTGTGTGAGSGAGAGGGGGGAGGSGTGAGKGTGTGKGTGSTTKLPTQQVPGKNVTINLPGMPNLTPGLVKGKSDYQLAGQFHFASGGGVSQQTTSGVGGTSMGQSPLDKYIATLSPGLVHGSTEDYHLPGYAKGGNIDAHNPEFFSEGGLGSLNNRYVKGKGDGTSDSIPAMLANGEFVIPADVVSSLGNGSNDSGAVLLDEFLRTIRQHKRRADAKHLPPDSKGPLGYLLEAKKKVKK